MLPCTQAETIAQLYELYQRPIQRYLLGLVGHRETAEDLSHEVFVKAMRSWHQHDPQASVSGWLYRIATNTAFDHMRRRRRVTFMPLTDEPPPSGVLSMEARLDEGEPVRSALAKLQPAYRVPLVMFVCAGHSIQEIATLLGCSPNTIKTRLYRARAQFRQAYEA